MTEKIFAVSKKKTIAFFANTYGPPVIYFLAILLCLQQDCSHFDYL